MRSSILAGSGNVHSWQLSPEHQDLCDLLLAPGTFNEYMQPTVSTLLGTWNLNNTYNLTFQFSEELLQVLKKSSDAGWQKE